MSVVGGSGRPLSSATDSVATVPSGTQAVSGTLTANAGTNLNTSALALETGGNLASAAGGIGASADAIVAAGAVGTLSAKLRRATQGLEDLKSLLVLAAGANIIGKVGIDQTTPGTTNAVAPTAGELHLGEVGGNSQVISDASAVSTTVYVAGYVVGGLRTLTSAMRKTSGTGLLQSIVVTDHAAQKAPLDVLLFNAAPAGTYTDHAACPTMTQADLTKCIARVSVAAGDYVTVGGSSSVTKTVGALVQAAGSAALYAVAVTSGTPTYVAGTDLTLVFGFLRD